MGAFLSGIGGKIVMGLLATGLVVTLYFYWEHVVETRALLAEQNKQLIQVIAERDKARAEQARLWARLQNLPDERQRICATRAPTDGCCKPAPAECKP